MSVGRLSFSVTYDYRCPFARNAHEHVVEALADGTGWDVAFVPFSLSQSHVEEGGLDVWDDPAEASGLMAMETSIVVAELFPEHFLAVHHAMFAARHDRARDLRQESVVRDVLEEVGVPTGPVFAAIAEGWPRDKFRHAHEDAVREHHVFGVPTFVVDDTAAFVRLMNRPEGDPQLARTTIEHVLTLLRGHRELNEFKHTTVER